MRWVQGHVVSLVDPYKVYDAARVMNKSPEMDLVRWRLASFWCRKPLIPLYRLA